MFGSRATSGNSSKVSGLVGFIYLALRVGHQYMAIRHIRGLFSPSPFSLHMSSSLTPSFPAVAVHDVHNILVNHHVSSRKVPSSTSGCNTVPHQHRALLPLCAAAPINLIIATFQIRYSFPVIPPASSSRPLMMSRLFPLLLVRSPSLYCIMMYHVYYEVKSVVPCFRALQYTLHITVVMTNTRVSLLRAH